MEQEKNVVELEIYLIRHGQSNANAGIKVRETPTIQDRADPYLTEIGVSQAKALGQHLSDVDFDHVYSSALFRAERTATEVINAQKKPQKLRILPFLTENGMGRDYAGATWEELHAINPDAHLAPDLPGDTEILCYSDHDDNASHYIRAEKTIEYLRAHHNNKEKICVVSHAAFITHVVFYLMGLKEVPSFDINFSNTGVTKIIFYKKGTNKYGDIIFDYINSTAHLKDLPETK
ncbi:MAG: histidine phosphatase family protein [Clostridia bacterium]|nr:histidine phosphatase family protein [Clostridia bacterium]